jgi:hypothetical protein
MQSWSLRWNQQLPMSGPFRDEGAGTRRPQPPSPFCCLGQPQIGLGSQAVLICALRASQLVEGRAQRVWGDRASGILAPVAQDTPDEPRKLVRAVRQAKQSSASSISGTRPIFRDSAVPSAGRANAVAGVCDAGQVEEALAGGRATGRAWGGGATCANGGRGRVASRDGRWRHRQLVAGVVGGQREGAGQALPRGR